MEIGLGIIFQILIVVIGVIVTLFTTAKRALCWEEYRKAATRPRLNAEGWKILFSSILRGVIWGFVTIAGGLTIGYILKLIL